MKSSFFSLGVVGCLTLTTIFTSSCDKQSTDFNPQSAASEEIKKIETAYYDGATKIETIGGPKGTQTLANQATIDEILKNGKDNYVKFNSRYSGARDISGGYDVGVIPTAQGCPLTSELVRIFLDNADNNSQTRENDTPNNNWNSAWQANGNSDFYFCKIDGRLLNNSGGKFAVLKLGNNKPSNVKSVNYLHIDCEDNNGQTKFVALNGETQTQANNRALPNTVDGNQNLNLYWYVFDNAGTGAFPDVSFEYGVLGNPANAISRSEFYTDDEDGGNTNAMSTVEGVQDVTATHQSAIYASTGALLVPERCYNYSATGVKFNNGNAAYFTGPVTSEGTRFFLARVK